jgi:hypothetical protein
MTNEKKRVFRCYATLKDVNTFEETTDFLSTLKGYALNRKSKRCYLVFKKSQRISCLRKRHQDLFDSVDIWIEGDSKHNNKSLSTLFGKNKEFEIIEKRKENLTLTTEYSPCLSSTFSSPLFSNQIFATKDDENDLEKFENQLASYVDEDKVKNFQDLLVMVDDDPNRVRFLKLLCVHRKELNDFLNILIEAKNAKFLVQEKLTQKGMQVDNEANTFEDKHIQKEQVGFDKKDEKCRQEDSHYETRYKKVKTEGKETASKDNQEVMSADAVIKVLRGLAKNNTSWSDLAQLKPQKLIGPLNKGLRQNIIQILKELWERERSCEYSEIIKLINFLNTTRTNNQEYLDEHKVLAEAGIKK